ncbi:MAG: tyrosine-type recombinase/integrase, partial [Verrucomicrobiae bacterium]|nr:tyrosine-type recombinase/integrase [Verrucomicrobiae bacterium]
MRQQAKTPDIGARMGHRVTIKALRGHPTYKWRATFIENGRRRQKGFKTKSAAEAWAEEREAEAREFGVATSLTASERSAVLESRSRLRAMGIDLRTAVEDCIYGMEKLSGFNVDLRSAIDFASGHYETICRSCSVSQLISKVINSRRRAGLSDRYLRDMKSRLGRFEKDFGERPVAVITRDEISDWLDGLRLSLVSRNNFRRVLVVMFSEAITDGFIEEGKNPAQKVKVAKVIEAEVGILTPQETAGLLSLADDRILPAIAISAFAGLRRSEIEKADWGEVDLLGGQIRVTAKSAKSSRNRLIPVSSNLLAWLQSKAKPSGSIWPPNGRRLFEAAVRNAGFGQVGSESDEERKRGVQLKPWPDNALRHSFASYYLAYHMNANELALHMGHRGTALIFQHYRALVTAKAARTYWSIT